ncbi:MAG: molybdopterin molybdenumtransferase MoeA, partial [Gammaproteobacteria bacterium]|nr:molybdopterin molybdenumtransferase MoeA [Gammaproteobacteria bacterium]
VTRAGLADALGRVLAEPVRSPLDVPGHTNSAVDGYALDGRALPAGEPARFEVVGELRAGAAAPARVPAGGCVRIMTGAPLPAGADTVIMQEHAAREGAWIRVGPGHRAGQNVRQAGEDLARGQVAVAAGTRLGAAELGLLASLGVAEVAVQRRLRVAYGSTGDELRSPGEPVAGGQIYDSNRFTLRALLEGLDVEGVDLGILSDTPEAVEDALRQGARHADAIITSGGVSVGEADYVKTVLQRRGRIDFWKVAIKPGRPFACGTLDGTAFFGLPGNPVAAMVTFLQLVRPALTVMGGGRWRPPLRVRARAAAPLRKRPGRTEFQRGVLEAGADGTLTVRPWGPQGSGILRSMSEADCFVVLPHEAGPVEEGAEVLVEPFTQWC